MWEEGWEKTDGPKLRLIVMDVEAFPLKNISSDLGNDERKWFVGWKLGGGVSNVHREILPLGKTSHFSKPPPLNTGTQFLVSATILSNPLQ